MLTERWVFWGLVAALIGLGVKQHLFAGRLDDAMAPVRQVSQRQISELAQRYPPVPSVGRLEAPVPLSRYDRLLARNPFAPVSATATAADSASSAPSRPTRWVFRGTAQIGAQRVAVLEETVSKRVFFSQPGDRLNGFTVAEVREHEALLQQDGRVVTIGRPAGTQP